MEKAALLLSLVGGVARHTSAAPEEDELARDREGAHTTKDGKVHPTITVYNVA